MIVDSLMRRTVIAVDAAASARDAARAMREGRVGCVIATHAGAPVGIVTERDITQRVVAAGLDPDATRVTDVMSRPLATIEPAATIEEAAARMKQLGLKRLVVVLGNEVRGILTVTDIAYAEPALNQSLIEGWVKSRWEG